jgi:hypothetical protein
MDAGALTAALRDAQTHEQIWSVLVEHEDGTLELHGSGNLGAFIASAEVVTGIVQEWMISDEPVTCDDAVAAGIVVLKGCPRCFNEAPGIDFHDVHSDLTSGDVA